MYDGLSSKDASNRLSSVGYNELPSAKAKNVLHIAIEVVKEPMFILLIACGSLYMLLGDYTEGVTLMSWVFIIIFITFYQHRKTERALEALKRLSSPRALVIRDGKEQRIAGREVVPDDIVILNEGDRVPADGTLLESLNLTVDESLLTGESVPVTKNEAEDQSSTVYSGTLVVQGRGVMKVTATGVSTEFGKIGKSLELIEQSQTNLQREMKSLVKKLFIGGILISCIVVTAFYFTRHDLIQAFLNGIATAMAMLPEEFPVVLTVFLAIGAWRLSKQNVLTRKSSTIETLGSATVLCSDKTGTITQNQMTVASVFSNNKVFERASFRTEKEFVISTLEHAAFASERETIDPMEKAIIDAASEFGDNTFDEIKFEKEYPLSKDFFATSRVYEHAGKRIVYCKGAPEAVLSICDLNEDQRKAMLEEVGLMAEKGQRVLAVAHGELNGNKLPDDQKDFKLVFDGLIGFEDPIRPEVPGAIKECHEAGIKVIMITGDYPSTAKSIAVQAGLDENAVVVTGDDLRGMTDVELKEKISSIDIFARTVPEQKLRIIQALQANNEVVAMTGDGVNDAPALKAADIGIAMGKKGTDVAREASSLVLLDDNFSSIVSAIRSGRRIYDNLQKAMFYIIAIHIPIIGLTLLPAFFPHLPILLLPLHIVFMELIIDPVCSIAFESEAEEKGIMNRPPRDPDHAFFGFTKIAKSTLYGILLLSLVLIVYFVTIGEGHTDGEIRVIAFTALIIGNIFLILTTLSKTRYAINVLMEKNYALLIILSIALTLLLLMITIPDLRFIFGFEYPGSKHFLVSVVGAFGLLLFLEGIKFLKNRKS